jgi:hypothetical protein
MKESITTKLLSHAIRKFANELSTDAKETQLIICTEDDSYGTAKYKLLKNYKPVRGINFAEVWDGDLSIFSFMERSVLGLAGSSIDKTIEQFIANMLVDLSKKHTVNASQVEIMIWSRDVQASTLMFHLYITSETDGKKTKTDKGQIKLNEILK